MREFSELVFGSVRSTVGENAIVELPHIRDGEKYIETNKSSVFVIQTDLFCLWFQYYFIGMRKTLL